jgi:hypothetical protein
MKIEQIGEFVICRFDDDEIRESAEYWTPERVAAAKPVELPRGEAPGVSVRALTPSDADVTVSPYKYGGKLTFDNSLGNNYASAQFMEDPCVLLTAAHCVFETKTKSWCVNFAFSRAYDDGKYQKRFGVKAMGIRAEWQSTHNWAFDYGFLVTTAESDAGVLKYSLTLPETAVSFGYPHNFGGGEVMQTVTGAVSRGNNSRNVLYMNGNPYGGGCSGGGWTDSQNNLIGINSFGPPEDADNLYIGSPLFDDKFESLYQYIVANK